MMSNFFDLFGRSTNGSQSRILNPYPLHSKPLIFIDTILIGNCPTLLAVNVRFTVNDGKIRALAVDSKIFKENGLEHK